MLHIGQKIVCTGQVYEDWCNGGKLTHNMNYSDVFTELIQAAGTGCEYYASDLFYDLEQIKDKVDNLEDFVIFIGIRTHGVDHTYFVKERINKQSCSYEPNCYIKLYRLEIKVSTADKHISMEL